MSLAPPNPPEDSSARSSPRNRAERPSRPGSPEPIAALNRIRIHERTLPWDLREPLVDIRTHCPEVAIRPDCCPYLRRTVAEMLNRAQDSLPHGLRLRVHSALRSLAAQKAGWDGYSQQLKEKHPAWPLSTLRRAANRYFAPYDQKAPPGHCTGGALDVALLDTSGTVLDMTSPTVGWEGAATWTDRISAEASANRICMVEAMLGAGFSNCRDEFWHYSYGDSAWAVRTGETECPYDVAYAPVVVEPDEPIDPISSWEAQIEMKRERSGRPLSAEGCIVVTADDRPARDVLALRFRLFWARGVPVSLRLQLPSEPPADFALSAAQDGGTEQPVLVSRVDRRTVLLHLVPATDRCYLSSSAEEAGAPAP